MSSRKRRTCRRMTITMCCVTSLLAALMMFCIVLFTLDWQDMTGKAQTQDSSDDTHDDCRSKATVVPDQGFMQMSGPGSNFSQAWSDAEHKAREPAHMYMDKRHSVALYMYTQAFHHDSEAARPPGQQFADASEYRSLYFLLSEAIQVLRHSQLTCVSTIYRTETRLNVTVSDRYLRFSTFVLGSDEENLSRSTCFDVYTCFGADITRYSALTRNNQVLIPPYEIFKLTDIQAGAQTCTVIYRLKGNLNCVYDRDNDVSYSISAFPVLRVLLILVIIVLFALLLVSLLYLFCYLLS